MGGCCAPKERHGAGAEAVDRPRPACLQHHGERVKQLFFSRIAAMVRVCDTCMLRSASAPAFAGRPVWLEEAFDLQLPHPSLACPHAPTVDVACCTLSAARRE